MRAEYRKEWMETYLWVYPERQHEDSYVEEMLRYNPGEGRLEFTRQQQEGEEVYCYKITGKKALNSIYAALPIGERQVRSILTQLFAALTSGKEYLLSEEDFMLAPQYIFAEFPQMQLYFCYVPGYGVPLKEQLEGLFEYLLNRVDYEDKAAVELLYDCYMFCMKNAGSMEELCTRIEKKESRKETTETILPEPEQPENTMSLIEYTERLPVKQGKQIRYPEPEEILEAPAPKQSYFSWLSERFFHKRKKEEYSSMPLVAEERESYEAKPEKTEEDEEKTVFLSTMKRQEELSLLSERTGELTEITKFPFYIGAAAEYVDFVPEVQGISRIHCCITKKGDNYFLSDLNSTNGTFLEGKEVTPGKEELLFANAELRLLSERFYIKFPCH